MNRADPAIALRDALELYGQTLRPLPAEPCALEDALGRVLAQPAASRVDLPLFTQSAVDGYALRSADVAMACAQASVALKLVGDVPAGAPSTGAVEAGTAMRILTGGALPEGADACARQEIVERDGDSIRLRAPVRAGADTRYRGEELKQGDVMAHPGQRLHAGLLAALAMAGVTEVHAHRRPRIAVLVTGDEIAPLGAVLKPGQVHDANGPLVRSWLLERGFAVGRVQYVPDRPEAVRGALAAALDAADLVITTGGVSVGDRDYLPQLAPALGVTKVFWQVAQKPGKPLWFGVRERTALLGLPGNPAAVLVGLAVHAARVLALLEGLAQPQPEWREGVLEAAAKADAHRDRLVRMSLGYADGGRAVLGALPRQDSHMLSNLARAGALAWLPAREAPYQAGETVRWIAL